MFAINRLTVDIPVADRSVTATFTYVRTLKK